MTRSRCAAALALWLALGLPARAQDPAPQGEPVRIAGVDGVKTGYTRRAQQTIVGSVTRDGHRVYVVLLHAGDRTGDSLALLRWAFATWSWPPPNVVAADTNREGA